MINRMAVAMFKTSTEAGIIEYVVGVRRTGAGAPKGNNNVAIHGEYYRPWIEVDKY